MRNMQLFKLYRYSNNYNYNRLADTTNLNSYLQPQLFSHSTCLNTMLSELPLLNLMALFSSFIVQHIQLNERSRSRSRLLEKFFVTVFICVFSCMSFSQCVCICVHTNTFCCWPPYLMEILNNYCQNRKVIYLTNQGEQEYLVMVVVTQGSALGPLLCNIMYD